MPKYEIKDYNNIYKCLSEIFTMYWIDKKY